MKTLLTIMRLPDGSQEHCGRAHTIWLALALTGMGVFYLAAARLFSGIGGQQGRRGLLIYGSCGLLLALASAVPTVLGALCFGAQKAGISFETVTAAALAVCGIQLMERTIRPGK